MGVANSGSFGKGHVPWNKGKSLSVDHCMKLSLSHKGRYMHSRWKGGLPTCIVCKKVLSRRDASYCVAHKGILTSDENHYNWKGGLSSENVRARNTHSIKRFRADVYERDDYTCQICGKRGDDLAAHHIESFDVNESLRFEIGNGITLCASCHIGFHAKYGKGNNTGEQLELFRNTYGRRD